MNSTAWIEKKIDELATHVTSGSRGWAEYYADDGDYFIRITNLRRESIRPDLTNLKYVALPSGSSEGQRTRLLAGDVLISITADLGTIGYIEETFDRPAYINQHIALVRLSGDVDSKFVAYVLASKPYRDKFQKLNDAGAKAGLNLPTIRSLQIPVPPFAEQRRIAEILSTWDQAIETTEKLITKSRDQKKVLMQQILTGRKRLPGFSGEWRTTHLENVVEVDPELLSSATPPDFKIKYISLSEVGPGRIADQLPELDFASAPSRARKCVKRGDVLMSTVRPNLCGFAKVCNDDENLVASTGFAVLRARSKTSIDFVLHSLFGESFTKQIDSLVAGSNYPAISSSDVKRLLVQIPAFEEQAAISKVLSDAEAAVQLLADNKARLTAEKSSLMQQLLTGKRRVKIDIANEEAA